MDYYGLDAAHFYTSPGLAWQAALKMTGLRLELLTDIDMHLFIERGLRGGISMIEIVPDHDVTSPNSHVTYWDANKLYGMSQALPVQGRWFSTEEI
jgi:hypothetical protein